MSYYQLTKYQRNELAALRRAGLSMRSSAPRGLRDKLLNEVKLAMRFNTELMVL